MKFVFGKITLIVLIGTMFGSCSIANNCTSTLHHQNHTLILSSSVVTSFDSLTIRYPQHHPSKLAIQDPEHVWLVIHEPGVNTGLMTDTKFRHSTCLTIQVAKLTGVTWVDGKKIRRKVFSKPGTYTIYMADNLETEPENTFSFQQTLRYKPQP